MKAFWKRGAAVAMLMAAASVLAPACVENESSLFIRACIVPAAGCIAEASDDAVTQSSGLLDVKFGTAGYRCQLLMGNQLIPMGDDTTLRTETSRIFILELDVTLTNASTGAELASYTVPSTGFIDPAPGPSPGFGVVDALLLDVQTAETLVAGNAGAMFLPEVIASVVARGRTLGGTDVESGVWQFPITVCSGCTCGGTSPACAPDSTETVESDCLFGRDGHCRFQDTDCP